MNEEEYQVSYEASDPSTPRAEDAGEEDFTLADIVIFFVLCPLPFIALVIPFAVLLGQASPSTTMLVWSVMSVLILGVFWAMAWRLYKRSKQD